MAGRAVVRIAHRAAAPFGHGVSPLRASIVPSLRSADASGPASRSGPARFACRAVGTQGGPLPVFPDSITLSATVARSVSHQGAQGRVLGCACGPHPPCACFLDGPVRALLWPRAMNSGKTVATGPTGFLVPTAPNSHKGWAPNLGIRCAVFFNSLFVQENDMLATRFASHSPRCAAKPRCPMTRFAGWPRPSSRMPRMRAAPSDTPTSPRLPC